MRPGQVVLFRFPQTDLESGKLRPALVIGKLPGRFGDWLISMVSSRVHLQVPDFDEVIREGDADFPASGLKAASLVRVGRLAVAEGKRNEDGGMRVRGRRTKRNSRGAVS
jgi:mRNA interferase MazF